MKRINPSKITLRVDKTWESNIEELTGSKVRTQNLASISEIAEPEWALEMMGVTKKTRTEFVFWEKEPRSIAKISLEVTNLNLNLREKLSQLINILREFDETTFEYNLKGTIFQITVILKGKCEVKSLL